MVLGNDIIFAQMAFGLITKVFDAVDVVVCVRKELANDGS